MSTPPLVTALITLTLLTTATQAQTGETKEVPTKKKTTRPTSQPKNRYPVTVKTITARPILSVRIKCKTADLSKQFGKYFGVLYGFAAQNKGKPSGMPLAIYHGFDKDTVDVEIACPLAAPIKGKGQVKAGKLYAGEVAATYHLGPYNELPKAHDAMKKWLTANKREAAGAFWEVYTSDPTTVKPSEVRTDVFFPLRPVKKKATSKKSKKKAKSSRKTIR